MLLLTKDKKMITHKIIFKNEDNTVGIIIPTDESVANYSMNEIADKDVPNGLPYWIVGLDAIPEDRTFRNAWEIDSSLVNNPDGQGRESYEFPTKEDEAMGFDND